LKFANADIIISCLLNGRKHRIATFPDVDATLQSYLCCSGEYARGVGITDALRETRLPPYSLIEDAEKEIKEEASSQILVQFPPYGTFNKWGIHIFKRFHRLRQIRDEVQFDEKWLKHVFFKYEHLYKR